MMRDRRHYSYNVLFVVASCLLLLGYVSGSCSGSGPHELSVVECEILEKLNYTFEGSAVPSSAAGTGGVAIRVGNYPGLFCFLAIVLYIVLAVEF